MMEKMILAGLVFLSIMNNVQGESFRIPVTYIRASSSLPDNDDEKNMFLRKHIRYCGDKAFDNRMDTVWAEGKYGPGTGEGISVRLDESIDIDAIEIMPGYFDTRYWKANNRIKRFSLETDDRKWKETFFCRDSKSPQRFRLSTRISVREIIFTVLEVYKGDKWDDTCLSELVFFNKQTKYTLLCNRIRYESGHYSLSVEKDSFAMDVMIPGEEGLIATFTLWKTEKGSALRGSLDPGSQLGSEILNGQWTFHSNGILDLEYTYQELRKAMGPEDAEAFNKPPLESVDRIKVLVLGEKSKKLGKWSDGSSNFICIKLSK
jgi:hypothetical protein